MKIRFVTSDIEDGKYRIKFLREGIFPTPYAGYFQAPYIENKTKDASMEILVIKQKRWFDTAKIFIHELAHWFVFRFIDKHIRNKHHRWIDKHIK